MNAWLDDTQIKREDGVVRRLGRDGCYLALDLLLLESLLHWP